MARIRKVDGQKVKALRENMWWTQQELADASGVTRTTIVEIERGRNHSPRRGTIQALAGALGVKPDDLLEDGPLGRPLGAQANQMRLVALGDGQ